jgi:hypothetical protein
LILSLITAATLAGDFQKKMTSRCTGASVVTAFESYSDCRGRTTINRIDGDLVESRGIYRFAPGELARLEKIEIDGRQLSLKLTFDEPLLVQIHDGPFTLYDPRSCQVEIETELPKGLVESGEMKAMEAFLGQIVERHPNMKSARESIRWNRRKVEPVPEGYEQTVTEHAAWKAEQYSAMVEAKLAIAMQETARVTERVKDDPDYMEHFVRGVETARANSLGDCEAMMGYMFSGRYGDTSDPAWRDGRNLVYGLELIRELPGCMSQIPGQPVVETARR